MRIIRFRKKIKQNYASITQEYILLLAAVFGVLVIFANPKGAFQKSLKKSLETQTDELITATEVFDDITALDNTPTRFFGSYSSTINAPLSGAPAP